MMYFFSSVFVGYISQCSILFPSGAAGIGWGTPRAIQLQGFSVCGECKQVLKIVRLGGSAAQHQVSPRHADKLYMKPVHPGND